MCIYDGGIQVKKLHAILCIYLTILIIDSSSDITCVRPAGDIDMPQRRRLYGSILASWIGYVRITRSGEREREACWSIVRVGVYESI